MQVFKITILCDRTKKDTRCERIVAENIDYATQQAAAMVKAAMLPIEVVTIEDIHETPFMWQSIVTRDV